MPLSTTTSPAIVGSIDWSDATIYVGMKRDRAASVGLLRWDDGRTTRCTAWLVANDKVVTNNHCVETYYHAAGVQVSFNYTSSWSTPTWYDCSTFVKTWLPYDMTVLQCAPLNGVLPGQLYGTIPVAQANLANGSDLYVLHQNCDHHTSPGCSPYKLYSPGTVVNSNYSLYNFSHNADVLGGSSGAPILSLATHEAVGLHHTGLGDSDNDGRGTGNAATKANYLAIALAEVGIVRGTGSVTCSQATNINCTGTASGGTGTLTPYWRTLTYLADGSGTIQGDWQSGTWNFQVECYSTRLGSDRVQVEFKAKDANGVETTRGSSALYRCEL